MLDIPTLTEILLLESFPVTQRDDKLSSALKKKTVLSRISLLILNDWPAKMTENNFKLHFSRPNELSVHQDCVIRCSRIVKPTVLQKHVMILLPNGHPAILKMQVLQATMCDGLIWAVPSIMQ